MEHCPGRKQGARNKEVIDTVCISLASFGDATKTGKSEYREKFPDLLQLPVDSFSSGMFTNVHFVNIWPHLQHTVSFRTAISVVACYKNLVAECDNTFRALLGDG